MDMDDKKKKPLSIVDIAQMAGCSVATVSRVINNSDKVSKKTKNKVMKVIESVDYVPNEVARGLVTQNSTTIGVLISDIFNGYYAEMISFLEPLLSEKGYSLQLCITNSEQKKIEYYLDDLLRRRVAGIIILSLKIDSEKIIKKIKKNTAVVTIEGDVASIDQICIENEKGMYQAVENLIKNGHQRIAFIGYSFDHKSLNNRLNGYKKALEDYGIEIRDDYIVDETAHSTPGYHGMLQLLGMKRPPTAVQCINEYCARGVYMALFEKEIAIPKKISVSAFDCLKSSELLVPKLTTVSLPIRELAKASVDILLGNISNGNSEISKTVSFPVQLKLGDSVKKII